MKAVVPGSFDPITNGHLDVIVRARRIFDEVIVAVGINAGKTHLFDLRQRLDLARAATAGWDGVRAEPLDGLLVDFCTRHGAHAVVKGARTARDFDVELQMARMNHALSGVETVVLPASAQWGHVSSTFVRQIATLGGDVTDFVPPLVAAQLRQRKDGNG